MMNSITDHLTHKLLPVVFARGYLQAGMTAQGRGTFTACYQYAAHTRDPDEQLSEHKVWMEPLYAYVGVSTAKRQDLDYFYVRLLYEGMTLYIAGNTHYLLHFTRKMGRGWWFGEPPASNYLDQYSLHTLLAPSILLALNEWKFGSPQISHTNFLHTLLAPSILLALNEWKFGSPQINHKNFKPSRELILLALELFTSALQTQAQIDCQLESDPQRLVFRVQECPCCTAQSPQCHIFIGVLEAFLNWLHGSPDFPKMLTLNEAESTGHTIVLDVPPMRSAVP